MILCTKVFSLSPVNGGLAQLARALAWQARGHRFDSGILHETINLIVDGFLFLDTSFSDDSGRYSPQNLSYKVMGFLINKGKFTSELIIIL